MHMGSGATNANCSVYRRAPASRLCEVIRVGLAGEMDHHGLAARPGGVVDPGLDLGGVLLRGPALQVERIGDAVRGGDAAAGTGERIGFRDRVEAIDADEPETLGVITWVGVMDVQVDPDALLVCPHA